MNQNPLIMNKSKQPMIQEKTTEFWECFLSIQIDVLIASHTGKTESMISYISELNRKLIKIDKHLEAVLRAGDDNEAQLIFLDKGKPKLKKIVSQLLTIAPNVNNWSFKFGLDDHNNPDIPIQIQIPDTRINITQENIFIYIHKSYKTSQKLHLYVYMEIQQSGIPKEVLKPVAHKMLLLYLGDRLYYKNVSYIKIYRRRYSKFNFMPLSDFKSLMLFKQPF